MGTIFPFLKGDSAAFAPETVHAMSRAFNEVCAALEAHNDPRARDAIAVRIIELARRGEYDANRLRDRVLGEAGAPNPTEPWRGLT